MNPLDRLYPPDSVKERLLEFIKFKKMTVKAFEQRCGMSNGYVRAMRKGIGNQKLERVFSEFPDLNKTWLLFGAGGMDWNALEAENWVVSENEYESPNYTRDALRRVGKRIAEVCKVKNIQPQDFAKSMKIADKELTLIIAGRKPAPEKLLAKILATYPDINPCWLYTGNGNIYLG